MKRMVLIVEDEPRIAFDGDFDAYDRAIDNHILRLRKQIGVDGRQPIRTVYGAGYREGSPWPARAGVGEPPSASGSRPRRDSRAQENTYRLSTKGKEHVIVMDIRPRPWYGNSS